MAKHPLFKNNRLTSSKRGLLIGAIALGTLTVPVAPAMAQPFTAPSVTQVAASHGQSALSAAETKIGAPYAWGATGPNAFDCSGLVQWAYKQAGVSVPRTSYDQAASGNPVAQSSLQPGDVVAFYGGDHIGIYAGNGQVIHAPGDGQSVQYESVSAMPFYKAARY